MISHAADESACSISATSVPCTKDEAKVLQSMTAGSASTCGQNPRGFREERQDGYTDLHHLRPADSNINGAHSNYGYDVGGQTVMDTTDGNRKVPTGAKLDKVNASFEPPNRAKGQVARMVFYMAVRYEKGDMRPPELMPDLYLRDKNERVSERWIGDLCTLVVWNRQFRPTPFERRRNDRVMKLQGNRNPFIDRPGWVDLIWGPRCRQAE